MHAPALRSVADQAVLAAVFEYTTEAVFVVDDERRYIEANPAACVLLGCTRDEILRMRVEEVLTPESRQFVFEAWPLFIERGSYEASLDVVRPDGGIVHTEHRARANVLPGVHMSFVKDVTASVTTERALRADLLESGRVSDVLDATLELAAIIDRDWRWAWVNQAAAAAMRQPRSSVVGRPVLELLPGAARGEYVAAFRRAMEDRLPQRLLLSFRSREGGTRTYHARIEPIDAGVFVLAVDTTEQTAAEASLRRSEARLRQLADALPQLVWTADSDGAVTFVNQRSAHYAVAEADGFPHADPTVHPDDRARVRKAWSAAIAGEVGAELEVRLATVDGAFRWHVLQAVPLPEAGGPADWLLIATDIHELRDAEFALARESERLRRTLEGVDAIVCFVPGVDEPAMVTPQVERILGIRPDEAGDWRIWRGLVHPEDRSAAATVWDGTDDEWEMEYRIRRADGEYIWVHDLGRRTHLPDGRTNTQFGIVVETTERHRAEEREREREQFLRDIFAGVDAVVYQTDGATGRSTMSPYAEEMLGYPLDQVQDAEFWEGLIHPDDKPAADEAWDRPVENWFAEYRVRRADGEWIWVRDHGRRRYGDDGRLDQTFGVVTDITEQRLLAEQIGRASRLESLGRLASGVAHDFANVMYGISVIASWIETHPGHPEIGLEAANIIAAADQGQAMTRALLTFARGGSTERRPLDPIRFVRETMELIDRLIGPHVTVRTELPERLPEVVVDRAGFSQSLVNLAVNARDAMPNGGTLTISLASRRVDGKAAATLAVPPGRYVVLSVADTGEGVPADAVDHLFEPFFTTKPVNIGTGLGLAVTYGFVKANAGAIAVDSRPGKGTTFRIYLPAW